MVSLKPILPIFEQALRRSTDEEWEHFKEEYKISPLGKLDRDRLFVDASGLVKNTGFDEWVLGKESDPVSIEGKIELTKVIREERRGKE